MAENWFEKVPRIGSDADFATLREMLAASGYSEHGIIERLKVESFNDYKTPAANDLAARPVVDALDVLMLLFVDGVYVEQSVLEQHLSAEALAAMQRLDLLAGEEKRYATVAILPVGPFLTVCDRSDAPDLSPAAWPADVVYPATIANSREFQRILPQTECEAMLDLGTGTGIAAFGAAHRAGQVWGTDIAARSVLFAEFGRKLNGIENCAMAEGDLYGAVEGLTFDRIVAHPPYVPARQNKMIFRDAGDDGEQILRRIVEGLPRYLRPGGRFYTLVTAADCEGQSFEERIRLWLGEAEQEFDLVMVSHTLTTPKDVVGNMVAKRNTALDDILYRQELWNRRNVVFLFYGTVLIRRHDDARPAFTARVQRGEGYGPRHAEWLLDWHTSAADTARLMEFRPVLAPQTQLAVVHGVHEGKFVPRSFTLRCDGPFDTECVVEPWLARVLSQCNGSVTWDQLTESAKTAGAVDEATTDQEFGSILTAMVGSGLLHVAQMPLG